MDTKNKINLKANKQLVIVVLSFVAAIVTVYAAFASLNRRNVSVTNPESNPDAASASCLLNLTLYRPTPSPTPKAPTCGSTCTTSTQCMTGMTCVIPTGGTAGTCRNPSCKTSANCVCSTPTPSATPACANCQYQADLFYGPVIQSFAGGVRYSNSNRLISAHSDYTFPGCKLATVSPIAAPTVTLPAGCENPIANHYLVPAGENSQYWLTDYVKLPGAYIYATIKNTTANCSYNVGLASYKANGTNIDIQNLNDYTNKILGPGQTVELMVKVPLNNDNPSCHVDLEKPAIYLYPETPTKVSVKVDVNGVLTKTDPEYGTGWNVMADPSGLIDNKYDYLFYEARVNKIDFPSTGWVVAKADLDKWFSDYLPKLGLNAKETAQFKEYWQDRLPGNKYFEIRLLTNEYLNENLGLNISPKPATVIRLEFAFKGLDNPTTLTAPKVITPVRKGFTVVEWGGLVLN